MTYQLIQDLCESRVFRSRAAMARYSDSEAKHFFYAYLLSTLALNQTPGHESWSSNYLSRTAAFANFDVFRPSGTDLYVLAHMVNQQTDSPVLGQRLVVTLRAVAQGRFNPTQISAYLMRLERAIGVQDHRLKAVRRLLAGWSRMSRSAQSTQFAVLQRIILSHSVASEVLPQLRSAQGTGTVAKGAAAVAAAGIGGFMLGLSYDPTKRMKFMDSQGDHMHTETEPQTEFSIAEFAQQLENHLMIDRVENVEHTEQGVTAVVVGTDGVRYAMAFTELPE